MKLHISIKVSTNIFRKKGKNNFTMIKYCFFVYLGERCLFISILDADIVELESSDTYLSRYSESI